MTLRIQRPKHRELTFRCSIYDVSSGITDRCSKVLECHLNICYGKQNHQLSCNVTIRLILRHRVQVVRLNINHYLSSSQSSLLLLLKASSISTNSFQQNLTYLTSSVFYTLNYFADIYTSWPISSDPASWVCLILKTTSLAGSVL